MIENEVLRARLERMEDVAAIRLLHEGSYLTDGQIIGTWASYFSISHSSRVSKKFQNEVGVE